MPLYEYRCPDCGTEFDALRDMSKADMSIECPKCGNEGARRLISLFSAVGDEGVVTGSSSSCASCSSSSCATCGGNTSR